MNKQKVVICSHINNILKAIQIAGNFRPTMYEVQFSFEDNTFRPDIHLNAVAKSDIVYIVNPSEMSVAEEYAVELAHQLTLKVEFMNLPF